ncbi:MAG: WG repeat-containing protein [Bacteroidetes bacterium]|nr:WG repeat-containing protein [Bacteroidota bacterium]
MLIFTENKCAVANENGKYGFIDRSGKIIIDYQFDFIKPFNNNKSIVEFGEKYGIIDSKGKYILNPQYSSILEDGNMFLIGQDNKRGWVDNTGKIIINPQFEEASFLKQPVNLWRLLIEKEK